jgi:hypothetical protein
MMLTKNGIDLKGLLLKALENDFLSFLKNSRNLDPSLIIFNQKLRGDLKTDTEWFLLDSLEISVLWSDNKVKSINNLCRVQLLMM